MGCSSVARRKAAPAVLRSKGQKLFAVASRSNDRGHAFVDEFGAERVFVSYKALLECPDVDAVYISLPNSMHAPWSIRALQAGKHVYCEKPGALSGSEAAGVAGAARESGRVYFGGWSFLFHPQHKRVKEILAAGEIGVPRQFEGWFGYPKLPGGNIRLSERLGGGALYDAAGYPVLAARYILGKDPEPMASGLGRLSDDEVDTMGNSLLRCEGPKEGTTIPVFTSWGMNAGYRNAYTVWGGEGTIFLDRAYSSPSGHVPRIIVRNAAGKERVVQVPEADPFRLAFEAFADEAGGDGKGFMSRRDRWLFDLEFVGGFFSEVRETVRDV